MRRADIEREAREYLDVPWLHQGRSTMGVDCAGVCVLVAQKLGVPVEDFTTYQRRTHGTEFIDKFRASLIEIPVDQIAVGDVLVFLEPTYPCHCGIVTERHDTLYFVHAHAKRRKVVEEPLSEDWMSRVVGAFRLPGLEE